MTVPQPVEDRCRCGGRLQRQTPDGRPYWCANCDAHVQGCTNRNHPPGKCPVPPGT